MVTKSRRRNKLIKLNKQQRKMNTIKTKLFTNNIVISGDIDQTKREKLKKKKHKKRICNIKEHNHRQRRDRHYKRKL